MKVYFAQEDNENYVEGLTFSFKYKRCIISVFTFIPTSHKRLNRIKCILRNQDKFNFTVDIWGNVPVDINLGKEIEVTQELIKFLVFVIDIEIEHEYYTPEHKELIKEWKQKNIINT